MPNTRTLHRLCLVLIAGALAASLPVGGDRADAATGVELVGSRAGFAASWKTLWQSDADLARELDGIASSGAKWMRIDFNWPSIEQAPSSWTWQATDRVVNGAIARGLRILAMPAYTPAWARPAGTTDKYPPTDRQAYARFVREAVRRYEPLGVRSWEIWNEPNQSLWWMPRPDAVAYTDLLRRAYAAIKAEDPGATVVAGGLAPAPDAADGSQVNGVTFVRQMYQAGAKGNFDALAMHPYNFPIEPMFPHVDNAFWSTTPAIHQVMVDSGDGSKKVWLTEYGAPTGGTRAVSQQNQADWILQAYDQLFRWPWAGPLFYYMYRDNGVSTTNYDDHFGLVRRDWTPKLAHSTYFDLMARPVSSFDTTPPVSRLLPGQVLNSGSSLASSDGAMRIIMQSDGNFVFYDAGFTALWSSGTYGHPGAYLAMQTDGNLVVYKASGGAVWATGTYGQPGAYLAVQNDGDLVLYALGGTALWSAPTPGP